MDGDVGICVHILKTVRCLKQMILRADLVHAQSFCDRLGPMQGGTMSLNRTHRMLQGLKVSPFLSSPYQ